MDVVNLVMTKFDAFKKRELSELQHMHLQRVERALDPRVHDYADMLKTLQTTRFVLSHELTSTIQGLTPEAFELQRQTAQNMLTLCVETLDRKRKR